MNERRVSGLSDRLREQVGRRLFDGDDEKSLVTLLRRGPLHRGDGSLNGTGSLPSKLMPRQLRAFPFTRPSWPGGIEREVERSTLGMNYDTDWARDPWAAAVRAGIVEGIVRPGVSLLTSPTADGLDRLDGLEGPVIFVANHLSHIDSFLVLSSIPARFRRKAVIAAGADYWFDKRAKAFASALALGAIPIERKKVSRNSSDLAIQVLRDGWSLIIFPEGGRSSDGWATDFKPGAAFLSTRTNAPIVPIHIDGTDAILPKGKNVPRPGQTTVTFGLPIVPTEDEDPRSMSARIETAVAQLADEHHTDWWTARRNAAKGETPNLQGPDVSGWRKSWAKTAERPPRNTKRAEPSKRAWP